MKRRKPLTEFERRRFEKRRELAETLAVALPDDRAEWVRVLTERFGPGAAVFAESAYPDRDELVWLLSSEFVEIASRALEGDERCRQDVGIRCGSWRRPLSPGRFRPAGRRRVLTKR